MGVGKGCTYVPTGIQSIVSFIGALMTLTLQDVSNKQHQQRHSELETRVATEHQGCECDEELAPKDDAQPIPLPRHVEVEQTLPHPSPHEVTVHQPFLVQALSSEDLRVFDALTLAAQEKEHENRDADDIDQKGADSRPNEQHLDAARLAADNVGVAVLHLTKVKHYSTPLIH